jgi:diguanylate cyclase (GGDEF)-like protein/PAS domain S-box-containing protein
LITLTDITEIKKPAAALREAEVIALACAECKQIEKVREEPLNRLQKIASQLPGVVFQYCLRADGSSYFPYASEGILDIYRLSPEDVREDASKVFALLHPDDYDDIMVSIQKSARDLSLWCCEYRVKFDDGTVRWLLGNALLQRETDGSTLWHGFITDITERKHREQQDKEHLDQLAHMSRLGLMSDMASGIVHEVNQPLTVIISYAQASLNLIKTGIPDRVKLAEILYKIQQQALRTGQIIQRMREFTQSHARLRLNTDVNTLIQDASVLCAARLKQNNIKLILQLENNLPPIDVDPIQIEQVVINIVQNSADALQNLSEEKQRQITIHSQISVNNELQIRIKDNGPGLNEDQKQKIMTPFYTTKIDGMGIGLSISRSIIEVHKGTLHFNSQAGKGTTFYITLPLREKSGTNKIADHFVHKFTSGSSSLEIDHQLSGLAVDLEPAPKQLMVELAALLANDSFISDDLLTQLKMLLPDDQQARYNTLVQHILDTNYPEAQAITNTLLALSKETIEISIANQDQRPTILVVDDARIKQESLATILSPGYRIKVAGNGPRALDIVQQLPYPDLILLDINMPQMNGYEVCQRLKETPLSRDIPVIFVTAASDQESEIQGLQLGAEDYISLPITPAIVLLRVRNLILLKQQEKALKRIAHYDALTGIPNRVLLEDRMKQAIAQAKREQKILGVCYLDLDSFKIVNDTMGHQAGDQVLIEIAQRIGNILREADTIARLGGDEFVILLPDLNHAEECKVTLKRLLDTIALPVRIQDQSFFLTASIGVSIFPNDNNDPDVLLRHADHAMYAAKQSGKNRYHLYDSSYDQ